MVAPSRGAGAGDHAHSGYWYWPWRPQGVPVPAVEPSGGAGTGGGALSGLAGIVPEEALRAQHLSQPPVEGPVEVLQQLPRLRQHGLLLQVLAPDVLGTGVPYLRPSGLRG